MKKQMLSLLFAAVASIPMSAMAIVPGVPYKAAITTGNWVTPVGLLEFSLLGDSFGGSPSGGFCQFDVEWWNPANGLSTEIVLDELKVQGNLSCIPSLVGARSILMLDMTFGGAGFNRFNVPTPVCTLMLGEDGMGGASGLIAFGATGAVVLPTFVNGFQIHTP